MIQTLFDCANPYAVDCEELMSKRAKQWNYPKRQVNAMLAAAEEVLLNLLDTDACGPDKDSECDLTQYPQDTHGNYWYHDLWDLFNAAEALKTTRNQHGQHQKPQEQSNAPTKPQNTGAQGVQKPLTAKPAATRARGVASNPPAKKRGKRAINRKTKS